MIKRQNWAVAYGGGEYGSEDSSDSELDEEDKGSLPTQTLSLSWAEAVAQSGQISSDDEDGINEYANMALRGPLQVRCSQDSSLVDSSRLGREQLAELTAVRVSDRCDWWVPRPFVRAQASHPEQRGRERRWFLFWRRGRAPRFRAPQQRKQEGKARQAAT